MEGKPSNNPKLIQILIEEYEEAMETEKSKEKKKEILDLFSNSNNLRSEAEFNEIRHQLHYACMKGDLELIKIYLSETIENDSKDFTFKIDRTNQTASLFKVSDKIEDLIIPRTFKHESTEYLITSISGTIRHVKSVKFDENSAVKIIYRHVYFSNIKEIYLPGSLKELEEGWCCHADHLNKIEVSPSNDQFILKENKYLLGKSDKNNDEFDVLLLACRNIKKISIPPNIKIISSFAFYKCKKLTTVEIPQNSNLQIIERNAFASSNINEIFIPPKVSKICVYAFHCCKNLTKVKFSQDSNLQTIEYDAFSESNIMEIVIPPKVSKISSCAFAKCNNLTKVEIPQDSNLQTIEKGTFEFTDFREIFIPPKVSKIYKFAFYNCKNLTTVEIPQNSNLQTIERNAFAESNINKIYLPASLKELEEGWCCNALNLNKIEVSPSNDQFVLKEDKYLLGKSDKNNDEFDVLLFACRDIEKISIPPNIKIISSFAFYKCNNLTEIEIPQDSNLQIIEKNAFASSNINEIFIPPKVSKICEYAFCDCINLTTVEFSQNSNLQTIEKFAFQNSKIDAILIPPKVYKICEYAFYYCINLTKIEIPQNSNLQTIERNAFTESNIKEIYLPASLKELKEGWCSSTLTKIKVSPSNKQFVVKEDKYLLGKSDQNNDEFDILLFACRDIEKVFIPPNIKIISSFAFEDCTCLTKIEIPQNSNLHTIKKHAFAGSYIESIFIPPKISKINESAFGDCDSLKIIEISEESELESISSSDFDNIPNLIIMIPYKITTQKFCKIG